MFGLMRYLVALTAMTLPALGLVAAQAVGAVAVPPPVATLVVTIPSVPQPTVPTPTVPVPIVPAPTVPAPTVPAPPVPAPTVPAPTVPVPTVPAPAVPTPTPTPVGPGLNVPSQSQAAAGTTPSRSASASPSGSSAALTSRGRRAQVSAPALLARTRRLHGRDLVRITFTLPREQSVQLTLRGPAPSCRLAGTVKVHGARGVNRLDFFGRLGRRSVRPGVYILSLTYASSRRPVGRPLLVQVVSPRRTILLGDAGALRVACDGYAGLAHTRLAALTPGLAFPSSRQALPAPASEAPAAEPQTSTPPRPERGHVLGTKLDLPALPQLDESQPWVLMGTLLLIGLPLVGMLVLVLRFMRGSWNP